MKRSASESIEETPVGGSSMISRALVCVVSVLGLEALTLIGLLLISPGCGPPT
jgi:hypothetical protein